MSVDAHELERAALQKKDREQLQAIATAMGRKPPSRARKDQIIDLILELSGVSGGPGAGGAAEAEAPRRRARARATAGEEPAAPPAAPEPGGGEAATTPSPVDAEAAPAERPRAEPAPSERPASRRAGEARAGGGTRFVFDPLEGGRDRGADEDRGQDRRGDDGDHDDAEPRSRDQGGPGGDAGGEGSGRRRRRRGKDRNRTDAPASGAPSPGGQPQGGQPQAAEPGQGQAGQGQEGGPGEAAANAAAGDQDAVEVGGHLDLREEGYGFLRVRGNLPSKEDVYVPSKFVRQFGLRKGDHVTGTSRPAGRGEKNPALLRVDEINGREPDAARARLRFEELTAVFPDERLHLAAADDPGDLVARAVDLLAPIGKGQRALVVAPPRAGKTSLMKRLATAIERHNPDVAVIALLVDERPEEVTDLRRALRGEVVASTFDRPADEHVQVAELTLERAKRLVESGRDVVLVLDGLTRLARAYNGATPASGRVLSGGIDTGALHLAKRFFGSARNVEEAGSLTILASLLVGTGSRMDDVIAEEFTGTANMELRLDRALAEAHVFPPIDIEASSTLREEPFFEPEQLDQVRKLRRVLAGRAGEGGGRAAGLELLLDRLAASRSNEELLAEVARSPSL